MKPSTRTKNELSRVSAPNWQRDALVHNGGGCSNIIPYQLMLKTQCHKPTMTWDGLQHHFMVILGMV